MICKRIRLSERRMKALPEIREGPIVRPCTNNLVNNATISPRAKRVNIQDPPNEGKKETLLENTDITSTLPVTSHPPTKTPLIVLTLSMPPETETLAPKQIKRDPRKQPSFCIQYSSQTKILNDNKRLSDPLQLPEIYIQGVELIEPKSDERDLLLTNRTSSSKSSELQSMINHPNDAQNPLDYFDCERDFLLNFDGYDLDINGGLPGDTRTPTPTSNGIRTWCVRRTPSPTTRQVIRVDVSMNKKILKKQLEKL